MGTSGQKKSGKKYDLNVYEKLLMAMMKVKSDEKIFVLYDQAKDEFSSVLTGKNIEALEQCLGELNPRDEEIVRSRFRIGRNFRTLSSLADRFGVYNSRIQDLQKRAVRKLAKAYKRRYTYILFAFNDVVRPMFQIDQRSAVGQAGREKLEEQYQEFKKSAQYDEQTKLIILRPVNEYPWSVRINNVLRNRGIYLIGELARRSPGELLRMRNFGRASLKEVESVLAELGLELNMKFPDSYVAVIEAEAKKYVRRYRGEI